MIDINVVYTDGHVSQARLLLQYGADPYILKDLNQSALEMVCPDLNIRTFIYYASYSQVSTWF